MIIGIGCDITNIHRFKNNQEKLAKKILTQREYEVYNNYKEARKLSFLAGRFAAKEAIIKALPEDKVLSDIEILNDEDGKPIVHHPKYKVHISLSHEKDHAIAYAIIEK